jgi:hypothetical protein
VESCLQSLIDRSPLYDEVVWGRRQSTIKDFENFLTVSVTELSHGDAWSIYKVLSDSPKGWITPEALENYSDLSFVFDSVEPSKFKLPSSVKDIGLALWLKELIFNSHKVRYSLPRLGEFENKEFLKALNKEPKVVQDPSDQSAEIMRRLDLWNWGRVGGPFGGP